MGLDPPPDIDESPKNTATQNAGSSLRRPALFSWAILQSPRFRNDSPASHKSLLHQMLHPLGARVQSTAFAQCRQRGFVACWRAAKTIRSAVALTSLFVYNMKSVVTLSFGRNKGGVIVKRVILLTLLSPMLLVSLGWPTIQPTASPICQTISQNLSSRSVVRPRREF